MGIKRRSASCVEIISRANPDWAERVRHYFCQGGKPNLGENGRVLNEQSFCDVVPALGRLEDHQHTKWEILILGSRSAKALSQPAILIIIKVTQSSACKRVNRFRTPVEFEEKCVFKNSVHSILPDSDEAVRLHEHVLSRPRCGVELKEERPRAEFRYRVLRSGRNAGPYRSLYVHDLKLVPQGQLRDLEALF